MATKEEVDKAFEVMEEKHMKKKETVTEKLFKYSPSLAKNLERMEEEEK